MPTSLTGRAHSRRGVTLIELLVVTALIAILAGLSFPAITSGIDSLRLNAATNGLVGFLNSGLDRAARRQQMVELTILLKERALELRSTDPGFQKRFDLPEGVQITKVLPELPGQNDQPRQFLMYPGGTPPRIGIDIVNRRGVERIVRVDPITGVPQVERVAQQ